MNNYFTVTKINEKIYQFNDKMSVLSTLVIGSEYALVLDTCYGLGDLKTAIRGITNLPLIVVNSHGHMDHTCGNYQFDEIYIDEEDVELCKKHNGIYYRKRNVKNATARGVLPENFDEQKYCSYNEGNLKIVKEGHIFDLGDIHLETVKIPGHTNGSIALFIQEMKIMIVSDGACPYVWVFLEESTNLTTYLNSLYKLLDYDFNSFLLGHGAGLMDRSFMYRLVEITKKVISGEYKDQYVPYSAPDFEEEGTFSLSESKLYEAGKCGILFNINKI